MLSLRGHRDLLDALQEELSARGGLARSGRASWPRNFLRGMTVSTKGKLGEVLYKLDSLAKPVLRKFQRFSTSERYRMLG